MFAKILKYAAKYGSKAIKWAWKHKWDLLYWGWEAFEIIRDIFA